MTKEMRALTTTVIFLSVCIALAACDRTGTREVDDGVLDRVALSAPITEVGTFFSVKDMGIGVDVWEDPVSGKRTVAVGVTESPQGDVLIFEQGTLENWVMTQQLSVVGDPGDRFGASIAIDGNILVVGAPMEDGGSPGTGAPGDPKDNDAHQSGAVYVFEKQAGLWILIQYLKSSLIKSNAHFGWSVALAGDLLVVGAPFHNIMHHSVIKNSAGIVNIFRRQGDGLFALEAVTPGAIPLGESSPPAKAFAKFGYSVATNGQNIVVGSPEEDGEDQSKSGAAYILKKAATGSFWVVEQSLKSPLVLTDARFGWSVDISGDTVVVGSPYHSLVNTTANAGMVIIYRKCGSGWLIEKVLTSPDTETSGFGIGDLFGFSVAIDGDNVVVTAPLEDSDGSDPSNNDVQDAGAGYAYTRSGSSWTFTEYLKIETPLEHHQFGGYLFAFKKGDVASIDGSIIVIGAPGRGDEPLGSLHAFE